MSTLRRPHVGPHTGIRTPNKAFTGGAGAFTPASLPNLAGWWKADAGTSTTVNGAAISQWNDQSGNARHLTQGTGVQQPLFESAVQNGLPVVRFDGVNDLMLTAAFAQPGLFSIFAVVKYASGALPAGIMNTDDSTNRHCQFRYNTGALELIGFTGGSPGTDTEPATLAQFNQLSGIRDTATVQAFVNGTSGGSTALVGAANTPTIAVAVGATGGGTGQGQSPIGGDLCEIVYYADAKNTTDRQSVEAYLKGRWATP